MNEFDSQNVQPQCSNVPVVSTSEETAVVIANNISPTSAIPQAAFVMHFHRPESTKTMPEPLHEKMPEPLHEKMPEPLREKMPEPLHEKIDLPIAFVHPVLGKSVDDAPGSTKKRKKNKKKTNKKMRIESQ